MPVYKFTALDEQGIKRHGVMEAEAPAHLRSELRLKGWMPVNVNTEWNSRGGGFRLFIKKLFAGDASPHQLTRTRLELFTRQLAVLLGGGLELEKALWLLADKEPNPAIKKLLFALHAQLREGVAFADCLAGAPGDFSIMYRTTIAAGERTGSLSTVLDYLAHYIELGTATRQKIRMALFYPCLLAVFSVAVTIFLLLFIVPDLARAFAHAGHTLPLLTRMIIGLSDETKRYGFIALAGLMTALILLKRRLGQPAFRYAWDRRLLHFPLIGRGIVDIDLNAYVNTLAMLLRSGVTLTEAMAVSVNTIGNQALKEYVLQATQRVREGSSLSDALAGVPFMPVMLSGLLSGAEASGDLARVLTLAAEQQSRSLQQRAAWFLNILEPCIIMLTGMLVLVIVLAMMLPILTLNQLVK